MLPGSMELTTDALGWCAGLDPAAEEALGGGDAAQDPGWGNYGLGEATVVDGVRLIAGGIENVLQRLRLRVWPCLTHQVMLTCKSQLAWGWKPGGTALSLGSEIPAMKSAVWLHGPAQVWLQA